MLLSRFIVVALSTAIIAGTWDAWWHGVLGRESFWSPPHLLLYASVISAVGAGIYGWHKTRHRIWLKLAIILLLIPASAPFDELWHRLFGVESLASPLIVWSPPHLMLIGALIVSLLFVLPLIINDKDLFARRIFGACIFASLLVLTNFLSTPLNPLGPYHLAGFWGAFVDAFFFVFIILIARRTIKGIGSATLVSVFYIVFFSIGFAHSGSQLFGNIPPHDHAPLWLMIFSILVPAIMIDLLYDKVASFIIGGFVALLSSGLVFLIARFFFKPEFFYSNRETSIAIISTVAAGFIAGLITKLSTPLSGTTRN